MRSVTDCNVFQPGYFIKRKFFFIMLRYITGDPVYRRVLFWADIYSFSFLKEQSAPLKIR